MSIRSWEAPQSAQINVPGPDGPLAVPVVTQDDLIKALVDGAIVLDRAGGCVSVVLQRVPTAIPHEMVTTRALVTWQDRTNAKPQAEPNAFEEPGDLEAVAGELPANGSSEHFDDALRVDPLAVDESDPSLRGA